MKDLTFFGCQLISKVKSSYSNKDISNQQIIIKCLTIIINVTGLINHQNEASLSKSTVCNGAVVGSSILVYQLPTEEKVINSYPPLRPVENCNLTSVCVSSNA